MTATPGSAEVLAIFETAYEASMAHHQGTEPKLARKIALDFVLARLAAKPAEEAREAYLAQIVVDLFAPNKGHHDGCLTKTGGPCQCGWSDTQIRYNAALSAAHRIAAGHDYTKDFRKPVSITQAPKS